MSGGSWSEVSLASGGNTIRRDTHDGAVPEAVFELLSLALSKCSNTEVIIFEQLSESLIGETEVEQYQQDFLRLSSLVSEIGDG